MAKSNLETDCETNLAHLENYLIRESVMVGVYKDLISGALRKLKRANNPNYKKYQKKYESLIAQYRE